MLSQVAADGRQAQLFQAKAYDMIKHVVWLAALLDLVLGFNMSFDLKPESSLCINFFVRKHLIKINLLNIQFQGSAQ